MMIKRSGEAVRDSVMTGGLSAVAAAPLLEPWLTHVLDLIAARFGVTLPDGYHAQAVVAVTACVLWISAHIRVRGFEGRFISIGPPPERVGADAPPSIAPRSAP